MLRGERPTVSGAHYTTEEAINEPPPISRIPVMIGGGGEKKTLRLVARYADESNLICADDEIDRKLDALAGHCDDLGRDRNGIVVTKQKSACIAPTREEAEEDLLAYFERRGLALRDASDEERAPWFANFEWGDPDTVGEAFASLLRPGLDGFTVNLPANGHLEGRVELLGRTLAPLVA